MIVLFWMICFTWIVIFIISPLNLHLTFIWYTITTLAKLFVLNKYLHFYLKIVISNKNFKGTLSVQKCKILCFSLIYLSNHVLIFFQMLGVFWACPFKKEKTELQLVCWLFLLSVTFCQVSWHLLFFPFWIIFHISVYEEEFKSQYVMDKASEAKLCANYSNCSQILQGCYFIVVLCFRLYDNVILSFNQCFCLLQLFHSWFKSSWTYDCL